MTVDIPFRCGCGTLHGHLAGIRPGVGSRVVCYCDDCQAFARHLGKGDEILDASGGTEVFQTTHARVRVEGGADSIDRLQLSRGGTLRWYAGCCSTPLANTLGPKLPFVGFLAANLERVEDAELGPIRARLSGRYGRAPLPPGTSPGTPAGFMVQAMAKIGLQWLRGEARPSPFFRADGSRVGRGTTLTPEEREALRPLCGP